MVSRSVESKESLSMHFGFALFGAWILSTVNTTPLATKRTIWMMHSVDVGRTDEVSFTEMEKKLLYEIRW